MKNRREEIRKGRSNIQMLEVPERENRNQGDKIKVNSLLDTFSK
jgi:hypothetical protein